MGSYSWDVSNINATVFDGGGVDLPEDYKGTTEFRLSGARGWGLVKLGSHVGAVATPSEFTRAGPGSSSPDLTICQEPLPKLKPFISMPLEYQ